MSYTWTKEDAEKALSAKIDRARSYPTEWQRLFHSEWQLVFQGESPWLSDTASQPANPALVLFGSMHDAKARLGTCVSFAVPFDTKEEAFQCNFTPPQRRRFWRYSAQRNDWVNFVDNYRERSIPETSLSPELSEAIQASRGIFQLQDNWDGEGSLGYSEATWSRAIGFLSAQAMRYWKGHQRWLPTPRILPGPDGNIDLHWKTPQRELLISIPADPAEGAAYYGDDREDGTDNAIRGKSLDTSQYNNWIFAWLMR